MKPCFYIIEVFKHVFVEQQKLNQDLFPQTTERKCGNICRRIVSLFHQLKTISIKVLLNKDKYNNEGLVNVNVIFSRQEMFIWIVSGDAYCRHTMRPYLALINIHGTSRSLPIAY